MSGETCRPHGTQNGTVILHGYKHAAPPELTSPVRQASPLKSTTLGRGFSQSAMHVGCQERNAQVI